MKISSTAFVLSLFGTIETAQAWPNGAGACSTDGVSVSSSHLSNMPVTEISLADAGFELVINVGNNETVVDGKAPTGLTRSGVYTFTVRAKGDTTFKGVLMRFTERLGLLEPAEWEPNAQYAEVCGDLPSLTHKDASPKTNFTGVMTFDAVGQANLLVDLVLYNSVSNGSSYAFATYPLASMEPPTGPGEGPDGEGPDGEGPDGEGPDGGPPMNMTAPPPMSNETTTTTPPPKASETTPAPSAMVSLAPVSSPANMTAAPPGMNVTMGGGGGKAPKTDEPMDSSNATTTAPTIMPVMAAANTSTAPTIAPVTGAPIVAKLPMAAPVAKVQGESKTSAAVVVPSAYAAAAAATITFVWSMVAIW